MSIYRVVLFCLWCVIAVLVVWGMAMGAKRDQITGIVYATWPDEVCRHVEPPKFSCDNLPLVIDDIVWVSPEWKP